MMVFALSFNAQFDHGAEALAVASAAGRVDSCVHLIFEQGPCLVDGIVAMDDPLLTNTTKIQRGSASERFACFFLLDPGPPQNIKQSSRLGPCEGRKYGLYIMRTPNPLGSWKGLVSVDPRPCIPSHLSLSG